MMTRTEYKARRQAERRRLALEEAERLRRSLLRTATLLLAYAAVICVIAWWVTQ